MSFTVGVDLGQASDYTAIAVIERTSAADVVRYDCRHLERVRIGTPYPEVASRVREMMNADALSRRSSLVVDATGVGRPVVDMLRNHGLAPVPITITGGDTVSRDGAGFRVPKRDLVGVVQVLLQTGRLKFAADLGSVPKLVDELMAFKVKINAATAHDSYGSWREGSHDDLVLAVAVACWYAEKRQATPFAFAVG